MPCHGIKINEYTQSRKPRFSGTHSWNSYIHFKSSYQSTKKTEINKIKTSNRSVTFLRQITAQ